MTTLWDIQNYYPHLTGEESEAQRDFVICPGVNCMVRKIPWRRKWQLTPVYLPGKSHRGAQQVSLWGCQRVWDNCMTELVHMHKLYGRDRLWSQCSVLRIFAPLSPKKLRGPNLLPQRPSGEYTRVWRSPSGWTWRTVRAQTSGGNKGSSEMYLPLAVRLGYI